MSRFSITEAPICGVKVIQQSAIVDKRGSLTRVFCFDEFSKVGWTKPILQANRTITSMRGTVRGMHYQLPPHQEMKLVGCLKGSVLDVVVDVRTNSPTLLQWYGQELSEENQKLMLIPEGVAHGIQTLTDNVEMLYLHSAAFSPASEFGINPLDPFVAVEWPLEITEMSDRDSTRAFLGNTFSGIKL